MKHPHNAGCFCMFLSMKHPPKHGHHQHQPSLDPTWLWGSASSCCLGKLHGKNGFTSASAILNKMFLPWMTSYSTYSTDPLTWEMRLIKMRDWTETGRNFWTNLMRRPSGIDASWASWRLGAKKGPGHPRPNSFGWHEIARVSPPEELLVYSLAWLRAITIYYTTSGHENIYTNQMSELKPLLSLWGGLVPTYYMIIVVQSYISNYIHRLSQQALVTSIRASQVHVDPAPQPQPGIWGLCQFPSQIRVI